MKVIFRPRFAPYFAPVFAPKVYLGRKPTAPAPGAPKENRMLDRIKQQTTQGICLLGSVGLGAGLMYVFDPARGRRRRAMARDAMDGVVHQTGQMLSKGLRDLNNRVSGSVMEAVSMVIPRKADDVVLREHIRSALGRCVSYPHAIEVEVATGSVTLSGHILEREVEPLMHYLSHIRGVGSISNHMQAHDAPGQVPDMQGPPRERKQLACEPRFTPTARLAVAAAGSFLAVYGMTRRGLVGTGCGLLGTAAAVRALKPSCIHSFAGNDELERGVDLQKTITIDAPLERVFKMMANPENFPQFMSHIQQVKKIDDNAYRWEVIGPAGAVAHWDAEITGLVDNTLLAWKTRPGADVEHAGIVRFDPTPYGSSRVHVRLSFRPPLGKVGVALSEFFSWYPKRMLDEDLARLKSLLEQGKTTAHHHHVRLENLG